MVELSDFAPSNLPALENPVLFADRLGEEYTATVTEGHKKSLGQYFTPAAVARFMATYATSEGTSVRILDPGCGIGILSCAIAERLIDINPNLRQIHIVAFETDPKVSDIADRTFDHLALWLEQRQVYLSKYVCKNDFITHNSATLNSDEMPNELFDIIVANPPYFKLPQKDPRVKIAKKVIFGQPNIYSIFMILATIMLNQRGQLIFITPRSFCSGSYFRLFREKFFWSIDLLSVHLFSSRKEMFKRDKVLQENVIITARKKQQLNEIPVTTNQVEISTSKSLEDINDRQSKMYDFNELMNLNSYQKILHLPINDIDDNVMALFKTWDGSLHKYDLEISTGPVVDFRSTDFIQQRATNYSVPLYYLHNIEEMVIKWPVYKGIKGKAKGQHINVVKKSLSRLVENKNYVLLRRFSSKDDGKRLISAPYNKNQKPDLAYLGIENHLNYIYKKKGLFTLDEVYGLAALLNSRLFDLYFRTFNGNINVSATELRDFPLPDFQLIRQLGAIISKNKLSAGLELDKQVNKIFNLKFLLNSE